MRIEKCAENDVGMVTVCVDDDTVRATDHEAVGALIQVLDDATGKLKPVDRESEAIHWCSIVTVHPGEGERILVATASSVLIGSFLGLTSDGTSRPAFVGADNFAICGVKYWARMPSVPQP